MCEKCNNYELLKEFTASNAENTVRLFFGNERADKAAQIQVTDIQKTAYPDNKMLVIEAKTSKNNKDVYKTVVIVDDAELKLEPNSPNDVKVDTTSGVSYYFEPSPFQNIRVSCTCLDFFYRFAAWNSDADSLAGNAPPPYVKKTDRASVNPFKTPGACKHILALLDKLFIQKILKR